MVGEERKISGDVAWTGRDGTSDEDVLAIGIGRAVLDAHRTASRIISDAQSKAERLVEAADRMWTPPEPAQRRVMLEALLEMFGELDRVEAELQDRRNEMVAILDRFAANRSEG